jgi:hypothetical protein
LNRGVGENRLFLGENLKDDNLLGDDKIETFESIF